MPHYRVESVDDERVLVYRDLPGQRLTRESGLFIAEGRLLVERLLQSRFKTHSILVDERRIGLLPPCSPDIPVYVTPAGYVEDIVGFRFHRGVLACGYRQPVESLASLGESLGKTALVVVCLGVQDPANLGGIMRNCAAFGADAVIVSSDSADPFARRVVRVSMGAALSVPVVECDDVQGVLKSLRDEHQCEIVATVVEEGESLESANRAARTALLIGGEAQGLSSEHVQVADRRVTIPMQLQTDSLNAAVASGVFLYHFARVASCPQRD